MPKRTDIHSVLIVGAGPIIIGQACEFDYSGTQACKALKEEGYRVVKNGRPIVPQSAAGDYNEVTFSDLRDASGAGVTASIRFGARLWPISYEVTGDGVVDVGLFSEKTDHYFTLGYLTHETREFVLDFRTTPGDPYVRAFKESFPLMARVADIHYINRCNVISDKLVSLDEELMDINRFQRAYQAAARIITTLDELYQTVLSL